MSRHTVPAKRRQAIIKLSPQDLERLIQLPKGLKIVSVKDDWPFNGLRILVEGDQLELVDEEMEPPTMINTWRYDEHTGRIYRQGSLS